MDAKQALFVEFAAVTRAIGNPHRPAILECLAQVERSFEGLAEHTDLTIANTSQHPQNLRRAWLAAALGHLGDLAEAQAVWAGLMAIKPDFRMAPRLARFGYVWPEDPALKLEGLVKSALPTGE